MFNRLSGDPTALCVREGYNPTVDYVRMLSALVIVQFHSQSVLAPLGESAVGFFTLCMVWFTLRGFSSGRPANYAQRVRRLMVPFAVWCAITLACKLGHAALTGRDPMAELGHFLPPDGSFSQLWFLPWAVGVTFLLGAVARHVTLVVDWGTLVAALAALGAGSVLLLQIWGQEDLPLVLRLSALYLPSVGVGVVIFAARHSGPMVLAAALGCSGLGVAMGLLGVPGVQQFLFAPPLMAAALMVRSPEFGWTRGLGQMSMDIYLVHVLVIAVVYALPLPAPPTALGGVIVVAASIAVALAMQRLRQRRMPAVT